MSDEENTQDETAQTEAEKKPVEPPVSRKMPIIRLIGSLFIFLLMLEVMIETIANRTLWGGRNGLFISYAEDALYQAEIVNTELSETAQVIMSVPIREQPALFADKVGKIERGTELRLVGMTTVNEEVWYQVLRFGGKIGYIPGNSVFRK